MANIPENYLDIIDKRTFAHLATIMPDGSPQVSPIWIDRDGDHLIINSADGRLKDKNMRRDPRVAISMTDPDNPYRAIMLRGKIIDITTEGADDHADKLSQKYLNKAKYPFRAPGEVRVLYRMEITKVSTMG